MGISYGEGVATQAPDPGAHLENLHSRQFSAYGTGHPIDMALGHARRLAAFKTAAAAPAGPGDILQAASQAVSSGSVRPQMASPMVPSMSQGDQSVSI